VPTLRLKIIGCFKIRIHSKAVGPLQHVRIVSKHIPLCSRQVPRHVLNDSQHNGMS